MHLSEEEVQEVHDHTHAHFHVLCRVNDHYLWCGRNFESQVWNL